MSISYPGKTVIELDPPILRDMALFLLFCTQWGLCGIKYFEGFITKTKKRADGSFKRKSSTATTM